MDSYSIDTSKIKIFNIESEPDMVEIQSYMGEITGARTVPRIFIGGQFIGGANELFNKRCRKWTFTTSNLSLDDISEQIDNRISSRLIRDGNVVTETNVIDFSLR